MKSMKRIIYAAALMCAAVTASYWLGYQQGRTSTNRTLSVASSPPRTTAPVKITVSSEPPTERELQAGAWAYKTVQKEMSEADLRQQMQRWSREGWAVLSISGALPQQDGAIHRKVELRKAKQ